MIEQITISRKDAEDMIKDFEGWSLVLDSDGGGHPWIEEMQEWARMLKDKLAGRIQ